MRRFWALLCAHLDQRFPDPEEERAFVLSGERSRLFFVQSVAITVCSIWIPVETRWVYEEVTAAADPLVVSSPDVRCIFPCYTLALAVLCLTAVGAAHVKRSRGWLPGVSGEAMLTTLSIFLFTRISVGRKQNLKHFAGDLHAAWVERIDGDDTNSLLAMNAMVTGLALSASLRVHRLLAVVAVAFVSWMLATGICGSNVSNYMTLVPVLLLALMGFACSGAAKAEMFIRREWRQQRKLAEQEQQLNVQSALASGMQSIVERLCDLVIFLDSELRVLSNAVPVNSFFGKAMFNEVLTDVVAISDHTSLREGFDRASATQIPQCVPVSLVNGATRHQTAHLLIASTGALSPKYLVGVSLESSVGAATVELQTTQLRDDLVAAAPPAAPARSVSSSEAITTKSTRVFSGSDLEQIAALGREEHWWIDPEDLRMPVPSCVLGEGGFGIVATACYRGHTVAVKVPNSEEGDLRSILMELQVLRRFRHPNVVMLHGAVVDAEKGGIALVYELISGMLLDQLIQTRSDLTEFDRYQILYSLSSAMVCLHLHSPSIVHGDLKPHNIMMEETRAGFRPKLLDFGLSRFQGCRKIVTGGTLAWRAPETLLPRIRVGAASDVYSFGWLALLIVAGVRPYGGLTGRDLKDTVHGMVANRQSPTFELPQKAPFREECATLCSACLRFDPGLRITMPEVQVALGGWVAEGRFCSLGLGMATRALRQVSWPTGCAALRSYSRLGGWKKSCAKVYIDADDSFKVLELMHGDDADRTLPLPQVGDTLCGWLEDPVDFRICVLATLADLRFGAKAPPYSQSLILLRWAPPASGAKASRSVTLRAIFRDKSGVVELRIAQSNVKSERLGVKSSL